jgi:hypothetical protein
MIVYVVEGAGLISLRQIEDGEMSVQHTGSGRVADVVASICRAPRCYWSAKYRHWVILQPHIKDVLADFDLVALRISSNNLHLLRPTNYPTLAFACDPAL